jgi:hypothetical protein
MGRASDDGSHVLRHIYRDAANRRCTQYHGVLSKSQALVLVDALNQMAQKSRSKNNENS